MFNLHLGPFIILNETSDVDDLYLKLLNETAQLDSPDKISSLVRDFSSKSEDVQLSELQRLLNLLCVEKCVPCIIDNGALLDDEGRYKSIYRNLFSKFANYEEDVYLAILHRRKPGIRDVGFSSQCYYEYVKPLTKEHSTLLLQQIFKKEGIVAKNDALREIVEYLDGYPPAIYYAADLAKSYGADALAADKQMLCDFKARKFWSFLEKLTLSEEESVVLRYLASEESLPLYAISVALGYDLATTSRVLRRLIDLSLVICAEDNYLISRPIHEALTRRYGIFNIAFFDKVQANLVSYFLANKSQNVELSVVDATLHAITRSKDSLRGLDKFAEIMRPSLLIKYSEESYHQKEWEKAINYAEKAERLLPNNINAKIILLKALSQQEKWEDAQTKLLEIRGMNPRKALYLEGFLLKRQKRFKEACIAFGSAVAAGDRGLPVLRDYADCLWRCNQPQEAFKYIDEVYRMDPENVYILDLIARICIDTKKWEQAEKAVLELERFDLRGAFVHHRKASLLSAKGDYPKALIEANKAIAIGAAPFETFAQKAKILIYLSRPDEALKTLDEIRDRFSKVNPDIQNGLRCELFILRGKWSEAYHVYRVLAHPSLEYQKKIISDIFKVCQQDPHTEQSNIKEIKDELNRLTTKSVQTGFVCEPDKEIQGLTSIENEELPKSEEA